MTSMVLLLPFSITPHILTPLNLVTSVLLSSPTGKVLMLPMQNTVCKVVSFGLLARFLK